MQMQMAAVGDCAGFKEAWCCTTSRRVVRGIIDFLSVRVHIGAALLSFHIHTAPLLAASPVSEPGPAPIAQAQFLSRAV